MRAVMRLAFIHLLLPFASVGLLACQPDTPYRYNGPPRPIAWDGRGSPGGTLHIEGQASLTEVQPGAFPNEPGLHASALHVTRTSLDGALLLEPVRGVELGVRATYSSYAWSEISTQGTMPIPSRPSLFGVGPEMRVWFPFDRKERFALGIAANALFYQVPFAEWTQEPCARSSTCVSTVVYPTHGPSLDVTYQLTRSDADTHVVLTGGLYPSFALGDHARYGNVFALLGVTEGFSNDGFTNVQSNDGLLSTSAVGLVGGGYGFRRGWFHVNVGLYAPLGGAGVQYSPGAWLAVGFDPRLWNGESRVGPSTTDPPPAPYGWQAEN